jgi:alpha-tubulin suppressor-like RCC1 family protein
LWTPTSAFAASSPGTVYVWGDSSQTNLPAGLTNVISIAAGSYHSLAARSDGTVVGWGNNFAGETIPPPGLANVIAVAAGTYYSLALKSNGTVVAWGYNDAGQTDVPIGLANIVAIAAGASHGLALRSDGAVFAWGANGFGQASPVGILRPVVTIAAGTTHSLALQNDARIKGWGSDIFGEANSGAGLSSVSAIAAGDGFSLAIVGGIVYGWGNSANGRVPPPSLTGGTAIAAGASHALALRSDRTVVAWGDNLYGQATIPAGLVNVTAIAAGVRHSLALRVDPPVITAQPQNQSVLAGSPATFTVGIGGNPPFTFQWRKNDATIANATNATYTIASAQTNDIARYSVVVNNPVGSATSSNAILQVNVPPFITEQPTNQSVGVGTSVSFRVAAGGTAPLQFQWRKDGTNISLAISSTYVLGPAQPANAGNYTVVVANDFGAITSVVAVLTVNSLPAFTLQPQSQSVLAGSSVTFSVAATNADSYQWQKNGANLPGETNTSYSINSAQPADAGNYRAVASNPFGSTPSALAALTVTTSQSTSNLAVGAVGWGESLVWNGSEYVNAAPPANLSDIVAVSAGGAHSLALRGNGTVTGWGDNSFGQAGAPGGLSGVIAIAAGGQHSLALRNDGTVASWGRDDFNQATVPGGLQNIVAIAAGTDHSLALKNDGTVVGWGKSDSGQTTPLPGTSNIVAIAAGLDYSLGLRANGTITGWGANGFGQRNPPAGLSNVMAIAAGDSHSLALRSNGTVFAWGQNTFDQTNVPAGLTDAIAIDAGANHSLALTRRGTVVAWGQDNFGQIEVPPGLLGVTAISAGGNRSLVVRRKLLRVQAPLLQPANKVRLLIGNADGSGFEAERVPNLELRAATNLALPLASWTKLTNPMVLSNGVVRVDDARTNAPRRFYITVEK